MNKKRKNVLNHSKKHRIDTNYDNSQKNREIIDDYMIDDHVKEDIEWAEKNVNDSKKSNFGKIILYVIGALLGLMIILMVIPSYGIKLDPEPKNIPSIEDVVYFDIEEKINDQNHDVTGSAKEIVRRDYKLLIKSNEAEIRNIAAKIATTSCDRSKVCYSKALYYFVRDNIEYVSDPPKEFLDDPYEVLYTRGSDCDGMAILLANLQTAIGIPVRYVFVSNHVFIQVKIDDAVSKYKQEDGWINLDATCGNCEFGELSPGVVDQRKEILFV